MKQCIASKIRFRANFAKKLSNTDTVWIATRDKLIHKCVKNAENRPTKTRNNNNNNSKTISNPNSSKKEPKLYGNYQQKLNTFMQENT
jgi:hypothetical protein